MDWNDDGKLDLVAGDTQGSVWLFLNKGSRKKPVLAAGVKVKADGKPITAMRKTYKQVDGKWVVDKITPGSNDLAKIYSKLHMADWDGDGLADLLVGHDNEIILYRNVGKRKAPKFAAPVKLENPGGAFPARPSPYVVDWDGDGKRDLVVGTETAQVMFYRNVGTAEAPKLAAGEALELAVPKPEAGYRWRVGITDWNNDGTSDLLVGNYCNRGGNIWLFLGK